VETDIESVKARTVAEPQNFIESGPGRGQDHPAAEARRLLEGHGTVPHLQLRVADLADAVDDPLVRP